MEEIIVRLIDKIRQMSTEELAELLIIEGEETDEYEDDDGGMSSYSVSCWYTPWGKYPHWWSRDDVREVTVELLVSEG